MSGGSRLCHGILFPSIHNLPFIFYRSLFLRAHSVSSASSLARTATRVRCSFGLYGRRRGGPGDAGTGVGWPRSPIGGTCLRRCSGKGHGQTTCRIVGFARSLRWDRTGPGLRVAARQPHERIRAAVEQITARGGTYSLDYSMMPPLMKLGWEGPTVDEEDPCVAIFEIPIDEMLKKEIQRAVREDLPMHPRELRERLSRPLAPVVTKCSLEIANRPFSFLTLTVAAP